MIISTDLIELTDGRQKHNTEASKYRKLVSNPKGTQKVKGMLFLRNSNTYILFWVVEIFKRFMEN